MPRPPKLSPEQWAEVRRRWEGDPRPGFEWIIKEMGLPVTRPAVRQHAEKSDPPWVKGGAVDELHEAAREAETKPGKAPKLSRNNPGQSKPSKARKENGGYVNPPLRSADLHGKFPAATRVTPVEKGSREAVQIEGDFVEPACMQDLTDNEKMFVREYMRDRNATSAASRAGYSPKSAHSIGSRMRETPRIQAAISEYMHRLMTDRRIESQEILGMWSAMIQADPGEILQHRRDACRHCWGIEHAYQYTPAEFRDAMIKHEQQRADIMSKGGADIGEFPSKDGDWYDRETEPNPDCPECFGNGTPRVHVADTRRLSPGGRALLAGVRETRDGIEVKLHDKMKVTEFMGRHLNLFHETPDGGAPNIVQTELAERFAALMERSREMQLKALRERGLIIDVEDEG